jgi:hypothetical protein
MSYQRSITHDDRVTTTAETHPDYDIAEEPLKSVRDCIKGAYQIKRLTYEYLPHPSEFDITSAAQQARYKRYIKAAEFDGFPDITRRSWLGKMKIQEATIMLPDKLAYLEQNADGDGTTLAGSIEHAASNCQQAKSHILLSDYQGLSDVDLKQLSKAGQAEMNPRASIKHYTRESLTDWDFRRVDGVMQISFMRFTEFSFDYNQDTGHRTSIETALLLGLDDDGNYYQQKEVEGVEGTRDYVEINKSPLKFIPVTIVSDEELPVGGMPTGMGMLYPVCQKALSRYITSADYKEAMFYLPPTTFITGWQAGDLEIFKEVNNGRSNILMGAGAENNLPENCSVDIKSANTELGGYERYFDRNADEVRALGGSFKDKSGGTKTATEAEINAEDVNSMLTTLADNLENGFKRAVAYCGMFEGMYPPDQINEYLGGIEISLTRDFAKPKLSVEEVRVLFESLGNAVKTRAQVVRLLAQGGWDYQEAEETLNELDEQPPRPSAMSN